MRFFHVLIFGTESTFDDEMDYSYNCINISKCFVYIFSRNILKKF